MPYTLPRFLDGLIAEKDYLHWLRRKTATHVKRDRIRGNTGATWKEYMNSIHEAVIFSEGKDAYTGEEMDWTLISKYNNEESKASGRQYKKKFAALPTVDHVSYGHGTPEFVISSWRTNDAKHDLTCDEFLTLCKEVLRYHGFSVEKKP